MRFRVIFKLNRNALRNLLRVYPHVAHYVERTIDTTPKHTGESYCLICERYDEGIVSVIGFDRYLSEHFPDALMEDSDAVFVHAPDANREHFLALQEGILVKTNGASEDANMWFAINALLEARPFYTGRFNTGFLERILGPTY